jgi:6-phosphogluconolactonase
VTVETFADANALAAHARDWIQDLAANSNGPFRLCLSGGSTPKTLYSLLADANALPWDKVQLFWGDERFVPRDDPQSNYRMVKEALLDRVAIPPGNVHTVPTEGVTPDEAALAYETTLKGLYGAETFDPARPLFDVMLLGLGEDGHTASLFPGTAALGERSRWVVPVIGAKAEARITLTYPALDSSRHVAFLVAGEGKRDVLTRILAGGSGLPAASVAPAGAVHWFTDRAAHP